MKKTLTKAPLVLTALHLRYSELPGLAVIDPKRLDQIHAAMLEEGFPEKIISEGEVHEAHFDPNTRQFLHKNTKSIRYLFRAAGERNIVQISPDSIILKSTEYSTFKNFYSLFERVLQACTKVIPNLDKALLKSVGIRYADVIVPETHYDLCDMVTSDILPPRLEAVKGAHLHGTTSTIIKTHANQALKLTFEQLPTSDGKVHKILPNDLGEPDPKCGLQIPGYDNWLSVKSPNYGILDIDHTFKFADPHFKLDNVERATKNLYEHTRDVFWSVTTETAHGLWGIKEIDDV